jgi:hypothetical protein
MQRDPLPEFGDSDVWNVRYIAVQAYVNRLPKGLQTGLGGILATIADDFLNLNYRLLKGRIYPPKLKFGGARLKSLINENSNLKKL